MYLSGEMILQNPADVPSDTQADALKLWVVLARAHAAVEARLQENVAAHGLTLTEFGILEVLHHKGPLLLGEVQRRILVSSGGDHLPGGPAGEKGLVERRECPEDRRARYAALTPEGESLIARLFPEHARRIEEALSGLSAAEQREASGLLRRLGRSAAGLAAG